MGLRGSLSCGCHAQPWLATMRSSDSNHFLDRRHRAVAGRRAVAGCRAVAGRRTVGGGRRRAAAVAAERGADAKQVLIPNQLQLRLASQHKVQLGPAKK